jgi:xylulokinase
VALVPKPRDYGALVGLDVGTNGARALAINLGGDVLAVATAGYSLSTPRPGWTQQDPDDWWKAGAQALRELVSNIRGPVLAVGLTGQMHGSVFLDDENRVIRPALLWNDQRTTRQCRAITEALGEDRLLEITGNPALTGFQAPKLLWLRDEEPEAYARVRHVLLPKDYVRLRLTGEYATDASDASGTLLLDIRRRDWSVEVLDALDIRPEWLPQVYESPAKAGAVTASAALETGLDVGIPVAAGAGDNAAAAVGLGIVGKDSASVSVATSGVVFADTGTRIETNGKLHVFCHAVPGRYHVMGVTLSAGGSFAWWRDTVFPELDFDSLAALASKVPAGAEGLLYFPYLSGERTPYRDPLARAGFLGLSSRHTSAHMTRAVLEGVTYSLKDCLDLIAATALRVNQVRATGGGARSDIWRQLQADILGLPVYRTRVDEGPAYGAALLGGVAAEVFADVFEACSLIKLRPEANYPDSDRKELYSRYHSIYTHFYPAAAGVMHELAEIASYGLAQANSSAL